MTRLLHVVALVAVIAVPVVGWFVEDWSGATTLAVYWFENVAVCAFIVARALLHQRWSPRLGHFRYRGASTNGRSSRTSSFVGGFAVVSLAFCAAHAVFLGVLVLLLQKNAYDGMAHIEWSSVGRGCCYVLAFLAVDFVIDLFSLRRWSFLQLEELANHGLSRVIVVHLTLILGFAGIAFTGAPDALFGVFVVLKTMAALSTALPQWEPKTAPKWLSRLMNRVPNVKPGERFEDFWAEDRADELARRERNEQPWSGR